MIVAAIANGGQVMAPYLVQQVLSPTLDVLDETQPDRLGRAMPADVAKTLTDLMIGAENRTQGGGKITGVQIAAKTGTAEHGTDPKATPPHNWYVAFAPAERPADRRRGAGGERRRPRPGGDRRVRAAPIGRAVIAAGLRPGGAMSVLALRPPHRRPLPARPAHRRRRDGRGVGGRGHPAGPQRRREGAAPGAVGRPGVPAPVPGRGPHRRLAGPLRHRRGARLRRGRRAAGWRRTPPTW